MGANFGPDGFRSHVPFRPDIASRAAVSHPLHMPVFQVEVV